MSASKLEMEADLTERLSKEALRYRDRLRLQQSPLSSEVVKVISFCRMKTRLPEREAGDTFVQSHKWSVTHRDPLGHSDRQQRQDEWTDGWARCSVPSLGSSLSDTVLTVGIRELLMHRARGLIDRLDRISDSIGGILKLEFPELVRRTTISTFSRKGRW